MQEFAKKFISDNLPQIEKNKKYFTQNDWTKHEKDLDESDNVISSTYYYVKDIKTKKNGSLRTIHEGKSPEYQIQNKITITVLNRLIYFHKQVENDIGKSKKVDNMINKMVDLINYHLKRVDYYLRNSDSLEDKKVNLESENTAKDYRSEDISFENQLYSDKAKITDSLDKLDLEKENEQSLLELLDDAKAPLSMREAIEEEFPQIKEYVDSLGIDFESLPKNEMFIHMKNPPKWNTDKHYFEQDKKTLQFYVDEFKKIRNGIKLNGQYISGWMYCHLNVFKTPIPVEVKNELSGQTATKDRIMNPPLRDNEWFIIQDSYEKATLENRMMFLCATRRAAKTTIISSHLQHKALSGGKTLVVAGGSSRDLGHIETDFKITMKNAHPAFKMPNISNDWSKLVKLGIKKKSGSDINPCNLSIFNLDGGVKSKSEILAGLTPDAFVLDECMKSPFKQQLDGALPAFAVGGKFRFTPILSGTGGNEDLSKDAVKILKTPNDYQVSEMDWDKIEEKIDPEDITWTRRKFGTFLPGQMSIEAQDLRIKTNLSSYLGVQNKVLEKIPIHITNWKETKKRFKKRRKEKEKDKNSLHKEKVYFPLDPEDILLSGNENPFRKDAIRRHKEKLIEEGDIGKNVELFFDERTQKIDYREPKNEVAEFPFGGGFHNSPVTIYEEPLPNQPFEMAVGGHDGYKQAQANSDSVGSFVIVNSLTERVVASYHSRPDPPNEFSEQGRLLLELYNAPLFMENEDMAFKEYTDRLEITDEYILKSVDFLGDVNFDYNEKRKYGWQPTAKNKSFLFGNMLNILNAPEEYEDKDGNIRTRYKFERLVKDIRLLDEMMNYSKDGNFDGLTALMSAYGYIYYLTVTGQLAKKPPTEEEKANREKIIAKKKARVRRRGLFPKERKRRL